MASVAEDKSAHFQEAGLVQAVTADGIGAIDLVVRLLRFCFLLLLP